MLSVLYTVLGIVMFGLCLGVILSVIVLVPLTIYLLPYLGWLGIQQSRGYYTDNPITKDGFMVGAKKATKLYRHWITGQELL